MSSNKGLLLSLPQKSSTKQQSKMMFTFLMEAYFTTQILYTFFLNTFAYITSMYITKWKKVV